MDKKGLLYILNGSWVGKVPTVLLIQWFASEWLAGGPAEPERFRDFETVKSTEHRTRIERGCLFLPGSSMEVL
jgi:hypothetical protein